MVLGPPICERLEWGNIPKLKPPIEEPPKLELKPPPSNFKYVFINPSSSLPVMITVGLHEIDEEKLLWFFRDKRETFGWNIHDMNGWDPTL